MIKKYKIFIKEGLTDKMKGKSNDDLKKKFDSIDTLAKISYIKKYNLKDLNFINDYKDEIFNFLNKDDIVNLKNINPDLKSDSEIINVIENAIKKDNLPDVISDIEKLTNKKYNRDLEGIIWKKSSELIRRIILSHYIYGFITEIPWLTSDSTMGDVIRYLKWLYKSDYNYHIDDNPEDIESFDEKTQKILRNNTDIVWGMHGVDGFDPWDYYDEYDDFDAEEEY